MSNNFANTAEPDKKPFRLIFHIGAGKTGTSSIQISLKEAKNQLLEKGFDYWGLMLEFSPVALFNWQLASASKVFLELNNDVAQKQMQQVLESSIKKAQSQGINCAIWSNEWFFGRHQNVIPALKAIEAQGVKIDIIAYVRRHDSWAKSAYVQWGIKHKSYNGPLIPFKDYISRRPVRFAGTLQPWINAFPNDFILRNFDAVDDVVEDFCMAVGLPAINSLRENESPCAEELLLRALYNNAIKNEALPVEFDRLFRLKNINLDLQADTWLASLLPNDEDLSKVLQDTELDRNEINAMLNKAEQPLLSADLQPIRSIHVNNEKLIIILIQLLIEQIKKEQHLRHQLRLLAKACGHEEILK